MKVASLRGVISKDHYNPSQFILFSVFYYILVEFLLLSNKK